MTYIAIFFGIILALVLFAGPLLDLLDFLLSILERIVEIFDDIFYFIGDIFNKANKVKRNVEQKKAEHDYQLLEQKREDQRNKLQDFQSVDELPDDRILLEKLFNDFMSREDQKRGFICLNKAVSLGSHMENILAMFYYSGIGTDENIELAKKYQVQYFKREIKSDKDIQKWNAWILGKDMCFQDLEGMRIVAENLIKNKNILGIFLLDYVRFFEVINVDFEQNHSFDEIYEKYEDHPYLRYFSVISSDSSEELLLQAAHEGCYFAAVQTNQQAMMDILKERANTIMQQGHINYDKDSIQPIVNIKDIYDEAYQNYQNATSVSTRLPYYEVLAKLAQAGYAKPTTSFFAGEMDAHLDGVQSLDDIKFVYFSGVGVSGRKLSNQLLRPLVRLLCIVEQKSKEQHYNDYLKKCAELTMELIPNDQLQDKYYLINLLRSFYFYKELLPQNTTNLYHKDKIVKKCIDKLEVAYTGGINEIIDKYHSQETTEEKDIVSILTTLKSMR